VATRENGEQRGVGGGKNADFAGVALARPGPETAPTLGERAKKIPTDEGWDFGYWWSWAELNRRPQAFFSQIYMLRVLIWISPQYPRKPTLILPPAALNLAPTQAAQVSAILCK